MTSPTDEAYADSVAGIIERGEDWVNYASTMQLWMLCGGLALVLLVCLCLCYP